MNDIRRLAVIGAGTMGRGIAQTAAAAGIVVTLHDLSPDLLHSALDAIRASLDEAVARRKSSPVFRDVVLDRIRPVADFSAALDAVDLAIESVPESLPLKLDIFRRLDAAAPPAAILATNTSALPVAELAAATSRPDRVLGLHFFNPVPLMPLLEVVRTPSTSLATVDTALALAHRLAKQPIVVRDSPGFATSRLGLAIGLEAMRMLEQGVASAEDIDRAMTLGYRHPVGPLRLTDLVGLDVRLAVAEHLHRTLATDTFRPPEILRRLVAEGKLGKKVGQGFYRWDEPQTP
ncbi:MAG: 3-hydroxyacyl-CoA dehydrogenase family protein [Deltaproteobacteria bacterium]|nr:3-hydroxyacyl-CoA dehydrogenase family protein [Deltaproteobacteria bacterium]